MNHLQSYIKPLAAIAIVGLLTLLTPASAAQFDMASEYRDRADELIANSTDFYAAGKLYLEGSDDGEYAATATLATLYHHGQCNAYNPTKAKELATEVLSDLKEGANDGSATDQYLLGYFYAYGLGVTRNDRTAKSWLDKAVKQGDARAMNELALLYSRDREIPADLKRSLTLIDKAIAQGNVYAYNTLALLHTPPYKHLSKGTRLDYSKKSNINKKLKKQQKKILSKASKKGNVEAMIHLARIAKKSFYLSKKDLKKAVKANCMVARDEYNRKIASTAIDKKMDFVKESFKQGSGYAAVELGQIHAGLHDNKGVDFTKYGYKKDDKKAFNMYTLAAERGEPQGHLRLWEMYKNGNTVKADEWNAYRHYLQYIALEQEKLTKNTIKAGLNNLYQLASYADITNDDDDILHAAALKLQPTHFAIDDVNSSATAKKMMLKNNMDIFKYNFLGQVFSVNNDFPAAIFIQSIVVALSKDKPKHASVGVAASNKVLQSYIAKKAEMQKK